MTAESKSMSLDALETREDEAPGGGATLEAAKVAGGVGRAWKGHSSNGGKSCEVVLGASISMLWDVKEDVPNMPVPIAGTIRGEAMGATGS